MAQLVDIRDTPGFPSSWGPNDDLKPYIQNALDNYPELEITGGYDYSPSNPLVFPTTAGLTVPAYSILRLDANAQIKRLPSAGALMSLQHDVDFRCGAWGLYRGKIDGNKAAHWPTFPDLGKMDLAVRVGSNCHVEKIHVFDSPGNAFFLGGSDSDIKWCIAENCGYIDLKFGGDRYTPNWDSYSADGYYVAGFRNLVEDCESYDCFRWDYTAPHDNTGNNIFRRCYGDDDMWRTYGFADIERATDGSSLIECVARDTNGYGNHVFLSTPNTVVQDCDFGDNFIVSTHDLTNTVVDGGTMAIIRWHNNVYLWVVDTTCPVELKGDLHVDGSMEVLNGLMALTQTGGTITFGETFCDRDEGSMVPDLSYTFTQSGGTLVVGTGILMGQKMDIDATHILNGGMLEVLGTEPGSRIAYGINDTARMVIGNGSAITEGPSPAEPVDMVVRQKSAATGQVQGYGVIGLTGDLVNNGKIIADGQGSELALNFDSFATVNTVFGINSDIENTTDNGVVRG